MSKTATIRTRIEPNLKTEVEDILAQLGLTASETVHMLYRQIKLQRGCESGCCPVSGPLFPEDLAFHHCMGEKKFGISHGKKAAT